MPSSITVFWQQQSVNCESTKSYNFKLTNWKLLLQWDYYRRPTTNTTIFIEANFPYFWLIYLCASWNSYCSTNVEDIPVVYYYMLIADAVSMGQKPMCSCKRLTHCSKLILKCISSYWSLSKSNYYLLKSLK